MKWSLEEQEDINFYEFMKKFVLEFKDSKDIIYKLLRFERSQVEEVMNPLVSAVTDNTYSLTQKRLQFIMELVFKRKELLEKALGI